jgi:hypothetical protein
LTALNIFAGNKCSAKRSANCDVHAARRYHREKVLPNSDIRYLLPLLADGHNLLALKRQALLYRLLQGSRVFTGIPPRITVQSGVEMGRTLRTGCGRTRPGKLPELVSEINRLFEARKKRLAGKSEIKLPGQ